MNIPFVCFRSFCRFRGNNRFGGKHFPTSGTSDGTAFSRASIALTETMDALDTKLKQLKLAVGRTESIVVQRNEGAIERHLTALKVLTTEADQCKRVVEESKISAEEDPEELNKWIFQVDTKIFEADERVKNLKAALEEFHQEAELRKQQKELDFEKRLFEAKMKYQTELLSAKTQAEEEHEQSKSIASGSLSGHGLAAKNPKLNISRFNGTYEDWPRFWN